MIIITIDELAEIYFGTELGKIVTFGKYVDDMREHFYVY